MNRIARTLAIASLAASSAFFLPAVHAANDVNPNAFVKQCDTDKDGMVSKAEMMKMAEKMFDQMDTKKAGKLDMKQVEAFLKAFTMMSGS
jgi:hypothetical protein